MMPLFAFIALLGIVIGSAAEILPTLLASTYVESSNKVDPYTSLELAGRDIYIREGCYLCHSQMIRTMASEVLRYGPSSMLEESMWDHPFQWGSKRTGPDLARVGGKYPDLWHYRHMLDPRTVTPGSIMPTYPWLFEDKTNFAILKKKFEVMRTVGVPYTDEQIARAPEAALEQAKKIAGGLSKDAPVAGLEEREIIALVSYLQRLGKNPRLFDSPKLGGVAQ
jgi:cytochrome c oxidase cbb3-type subunit I/II